MNKLIFLSLLFSSMVFAQNKPKGPLDIKVKDGEKKFNGNAKPGDSKSTNGKDPNAPGFDPKCGLNPNENPDENPWQNSTVTLTAPAVKPKGRICVHYIKKQYKGELCGFRKYYYLNFTKAQLTNLVSSSMEKGYMGGSTGASGGNLDWSIVSDKIVSGVDNYLKTKRPKAMEECRTKGWIKPPSFGSNWPICKELDFGDHVLGYNVELNYDVEQKAKQTNCTKYASTFLQRPVRVTNTQKMSLMIEADKVNGSGFNNINFTLQIHNDATKTPVGSPDSKNMSRNGSVTFDLDGMKSDEWFVVNSDFIQQAIAASPSGSGASSTSGLMNQLTQSTTANGQGFGMYLVRRPDEATPNLAPDTIDKCGLEEPSEELMAKAVQAAGGKCLH